MRITVDCYSFTPHDGERLTEFLAHEFGMPRTDVHVSVFFDSNENDSALAQAVLKGFGDKLASVAYIPREPRS